MEYTLYTLDPLTPKSLQWTMKWYSYMHYSALVDIYLWLGGTCRLILAKKFNRHAPPKIAILKITCETQAQCHVKLREI